MLNYYFLFFDGQILLTAEHQLPLTESSPLPLSETTALHPLPELDGHPCFTASTNNEATPHAPYQWVPLRQSFDLLPPTHYAMAGKAEEISYWHDHTRYCSTCGAPMTTDSPISKHCTACGRQIWPALATAVIVAITRNEGKEILLVQSHKFKYDFYGLVAGYVETGETLEQAVHREVLEETGLRIRHLRYFASQPWPYPSELMVAFTAEYESGTLQLQTSELKKGNWFSLHNLPTIPGKVSITRRLIDHWIATQE